MPAIIAKIYSRWQTKAANGAKITRGHINRTINYVLEHTPEKDRPRVLGGQGFEYAITDEETARRAGRDMEGLSDQGPPYPPGPRPNPLLHISLSWPPSENPSDEHMVESGRSALRALGAERAWGVFVRHHDTEHHHMHFVGSRIDPETRSTFAALRGYNRDRPKLLEWARTYEREHQRELERLPERSLANDNHPWMRELLQVWGENQQQRPLDQSWLKTPENFREFADAHGLGRVSAKEAEKLIRDQANEKFLRDYQFPDKPERTPALEHQHEPTEGMPFYSPMGAKVVNRVLNEHQRTDWNELEPVEKVALKKDSRERGMGREMDIFGFDDGSSRGESGYGGD